MTVDISTTIGGVKMRTPFGVSSHDLDKMWFPGKKLSDLMMKFVDAGAGFILGPAIIPGDTLEEEKRGEWRKLMSKQHLGRWLRVDGHTGVFSGRYLQHKLSYFDEWISALKPRLPKDVPILGQALLYDFSPEAWAKHAKRMESMGVDMIEVNAGCPYDGPMESEESVTLPDETKYGMLIVGGIGTEPDLLAAIIKAVSEAVKVPVGFKLTGEASCPRFLAVCEKAIKAGAKWVVTNHSSLAVAPPDIWKGGRTKFPAIDGNPYMAGLMGSALRMQSYKTTAMISKTFPELNCWAAGGIDEPEHVVEAMMLGAKAAQCLNGIVINGIKFITDVNNFITDFMEKCDYKAIDDFRGLALKHLCSVSECEFLDYVAQTDFSRCIGCGACAETICPATTMMGGKPVIDIDLCSGCGMCAVVCPNDAIQFVPREEANAKKVQ